MIGYLCTQLCVLLVVVELVAARGGVCCVLGFYTTIEPESFSVAAQGALCQWHAGPYGIYHYSGGIVFLLHSALSDDG